MSAVGKAVSGVTNFLVGGKPKYHENKAYGEMSPEEKARLNDIENQFQSMDPETQNALTSLFQDQLKSFIVGGSQNPNPTAEQLQQATQFVDQTFTNQAQQQLQQQGQDFASQQQAQAAALGRNPNADIATQQAIMSTMARAGQGLQAERGARIAQTSRELNDVGYNRGLQNLSAGMQGVGYLNSLGQQAFQNRLGLLNARTGIADYYQRNRANQGTTQTTSSGMLTNLNAIQNGVSNVALGVGKLGGFL